MSGSAPLRGHVRVSKVLVDRTRELAAARLQPAKFMERFSPVPMLPPVGGTSGVAALLQQRSMLHGTNWLDAKHYPQMLFRIRDSVQPKAQRLANQLDLPPLELPFWILGHALCDFGKVVDDMLGLHTHARYR